MSRRKAANIAQMRWLLSGELLVWWQWIGLASTVASLLTVPSVLVHRRGRPTAALSWLLALFIVPWVGVVLWWLFGRRYLERRRRRRRRALATIGKRFALLRETIGPRSFDEPALLPIKKLPGTLARSVFPPTAGNAVELLAGGREAFERIEHLIAEARHHVHALFYIWKDDETGRRLRDLLIDKARAGVQVRVLCDAIGAPIMGSRFAAPLRRAGARVALFLPIANIARVPRLNFRNHRKIVVVDGKVGIVGGFNIADEYRKRWRDLGAQVEGPSVDQLQEVFAEDWYFATGEDVVDAEHFGLCPPHSGGEACAIVASGPDMDPNPMHDVLFVAINQTEQRLYITTPYFIPSRELNAALRAAVYRGVDVRIMVPSDSDVPFVHRASRAYFPELLAVGVRIFEYQPSMLHTKALVFDHHLALIGSANMDSRSFRLNFETSCFFGGTQLNGKLAELFERDLEKCKEQRFGALERRPWGTKLLDSAAQLLSPLL